MIVDQVYASMFSFHPKYTLKTSLRNLFLVYTAKKYNRDLNLLDTDISSQWIRTAERKSKVAKNPYELPGDQRGKHNSRPTRVPKGLTDSARSHISSFPVMDSENGEDNAPKKFVEVGLNITRMYRLYREEMEKNRQKDYVSKQKYREIFNTEFNYGFVVSKKDR